MASRSWFWLRTRIFGLFSRPITRDVNGNPVFTTRVQARFPRSVSEEPPRAAQR